MKAVIALAILFATPAVADPKPVTVDPAKPATVTLPIQDWQSVLLSVQDSARVSARDANRIGQTIVNQVQPQLALNQPAKPKN